MTTLAIIGSGFLGRTLLYTLAKEQKAFKKITLISSEVYAPPCSLNSTAIVAPRGLTLGHSPLGDYLLQGFLDFKKHVEENSPEGVWPIIQYNGSGKNLDNFKKRYPVGKFTRELSGIQLKNEFYFMPEDGFMLDPKTYMDWLLMEVMRLKKFELELISDFVIEVNDPDRPQIKTQDGQLLQFDKVVFTGGSYNRFWAQLMPKSVLETSKPVPGSYLEFSRIGWDLPSFSLTLDGDNLIWNRGMNILIIGATTDTVAHVLPPVTDLRNIFNRLVCAIDLSFPDFDQGMVKTGIREKARKREPYTLKRDQLYLMGGMYKNGCSLPIKMTKDFSHQYL